jgi:hypothetical protein
LKWQIGNHTYPYLDKQAPFRSVYDFLVSHTGQLIPLISRVYEEYQEQLQTRQNLVELRIETLTVGLEPRRTYE